MPSKTTVFEAPWIKMKRNLKLLDNSLVKVGVMTKSTGKLAPAKGKKKHTYDDLLSIAIANEFGTLDKGGFIPARSYLRSTFDEKQDKVSVLIERNYNTFLFKSPKLALDRVGIYFTGQVQLKIRNLKSPPNAESTIKRKKYSNPLIDTGQLRQSITHQTTISR